MPSEFSPEVKFEIGHVLFIDIVGYSKLLINEQSEQIQKLKEIVRGTEQVRLAEAEGKLLRLPTGDGGALVFRNSPEAPVRCALEISKELKDYPELRVRMGIHSGPVNEVVDLNEQANIAGAGINIAQRVMDCGDAGHILLSRHVAEDLEHYPRWQRFLHDLGEADVKHGHKVSVVNLYNEDFGNPALPEKFRAKDIRVAPAVAASDAKTVRWPRTLIGAIVILAAVAAAAGYYISLQRPVAKAVLEKSVAVLPFENLSDDRSNAYFAEGIQDEILTKLASIANLKVISRTSTAKYKSKPEDLKTVSQQLGVANVVEGAVQRAGEKVRVNVQLIDARRDSHLWAKSYDRDITDVFAVESEISQEIADSLQAKLSPNEASALASAPTQDPEAYDLFLKGEYAERQAESTRKTEAYEQAADFYQRAIARDPNFALAIARSVENRVARHWLIDRLSETELEKIKQTAEHALALSPNLAEAHLALGLFYLLGQLRYDEALTRFQRAQELQPNSVRALRYIASTHSRQGQWERSLAEYEKCEGLDPLDPTLPGSIGLTYTYLRMWKEAARAGARALALDPHNDTGMRALLLSYLNGSADIEEATRALATFSPGASLVTNSWDLQNIIGLATYVYVIKRDFGAALKAWDKESSDPTANRQRLSARVAIHVLAGDASSAREEIESARGLVEARVRERPDDKNALIQLSWIYIALNREADALKLAQHSAQLLPPEKDAVGGSIALLGLAEIEARTGHTIEAVKTLQRLLTMPALISLQRLKIDPVWDPIRNDPGFQQLLAGTEQIGPNK
jgi:TolB-like protein/cytochrome c-type biogenesis protein CcmH/NrfG